MIVLRCRNVSASTGFRAVSVGKVTRCVLLSGWGLVRGAREASPSQASPAKSPELSGCSATSTAARLGGQWPFVSIAFGVEPRHSPFQLLAVGKVTRIVRCNSSHLGPKGHQICVLGSVEPQGPTLCRAADGREGGKVTGIVRMPRFRVRQSHRICPDEPQIQAWSCVRHAQQADCLLAYGGLLATFCGN